MKKIEKEFFWSVFFVTIVALINYSFAHETVYIIQKFIIYVVCDYFFCRLMAKLLQSLKIFNIDWMAILFKILIINSENHDICCMWLFFFCRLMAETAAITYNLNMDWMTIFFFILIKNRGCLKLVFRCQHHLQPRLFFLIPITLLAFSFDVCYWLLWHTHK